MDREITTHITITYLGEVPEVKFGKEKLVTILKAVEWETVGKATVKGLELFGPDADFLVMTLDSSALHLNRELVENALTSAGIENMNSYPDYQPHITLMHGYQGEFPVRTSLPEHVTVGVPALWWGVEVIPLT